MTDRIDAIIAQEEQLLKMAVAKTMAAYQKESTIVNLREMQGAKKAWDEYQRKQKEATEGQRFKNLAEVARWLTREGYKCQERTVRNHHKAGLIPVQPGGEFRQTDVEGYARLHLERPGRDEREREASTAKDRLALAMADERELRNKKFRGELIDAAEEEARDARLWGAVRADLENNAPGVVAELVERVNARLPAEFHPQVLALVPELREAYEQYMDEMFDRYAREGGMEAAE